MKIRTILYSSCLSVGLLSCQEKMQIESMPQSNFTEKDQTIELSTSIDPIYEYDDTTPRAALFSAEDSPRVKLTQEQFNSFFNPNSPYTYTTFRVLWLRYRNTDNHQNQAEYITFYNGQQINGHVAKIEVKELGGKYQIKSWLKLRDLPSLEPKDGYTWFGQVILGGLPGQAPIQVSNEANKRREERWYQYYSQRRPSANDNEKWVNSEPNDRIDELAPNNGEMAHRHFPLVGDIVKLRLWNQPGALGDYGGKNNTGQLGGDTEMKIRPRGSIFTLTFENQTGHNIEVTDIEVPFKGSRGKAFSFEGAFISGDLQPFSGGVINPAGCIPRYERYDDPERSGDETRLFPVFRKGGARNVPMGVGETRGRFMVWTYAHEPQQMRPFTVRVRYTTNGNSQVMTSQYQTINPPKYGFQEGKAYRFVLKIK